MEQYHEIDNRIEIELDRLSDWGEVRDVVVTKGDTVGFLFTSHRHDEFEIRVNYRTDEGLLIDHGERVSALSNGDQWIW
jgi:hypothetical protein